VTITTHLASVYLTQVERRTHRWSVAK